MKIILLQVILVIGANYIPLRIVNDNVQPLVAYVGENFTYECRLLKSKQLDSIVFFTWGVYLGVNDATGNLRVTKPKSGATLTILNVAKEDERQYICVVSDQQKQDHKIFNLTVLSNEEEMGAPGFGWADGVGCDTQNGIKLCQCKGDGCNSALPLTSWGVLLLLPLVVSYLMG